MIANSNISSNQQTIKKSCSLDGIGLHSGKKVKITVEPASVNNGIKFIRTDLKKNNIVAALWSNVSSTNLCTTISNEKGVSISTIEHLMAALYGQNIDNALIEINNSEVPILDGSAKKFVEEINRVGLKISETPIKIIKIEKKVTLENGSKTMSIEPSKISLDIDFEIKYENSLIGTQRNLVKVYETDLSEIYNSRTFCLFEDIKRLKEMNLAKGGSLENAVVVKGNKILNKEGLRNKKEFVNHKILDCIGDLYLLGYKVIGKIQCSGGGHKLTNELLRKVFQDNNNFSIVEIKEKNIPHSFINKSFLKSIA